MLFTSIFYVKTLNFCNLKNVTVFYWHVLGFFKKLGFDLLCCILQIPDFLPLGRKELIVLNIHLLELVSEIFLFLLMRFNFKIIFNCAPCRVLRFYFWNSFRVNHCCSLTVFFPQSFQFFFQMIIFFSHGCKTFGFFHYGLL